MTHGDPSRSKPITSPASVRLTADRCGMVVAAISIGGRALLRGHVPRPDIDKMIIDQI
jgi:hypothetical protein